MAPFDNFLTKNHDSGNTGVNTGILSIYPGITVCTPVIPGMLATLYLTKHVNSLDVLLHPGPDGCDERGLIPLTSSDTALHHVLLLPVPLFAG